MPGDTDAMINGFLLAAIAVLLILVIVRAYRRAYRRAAARRAAGRQGFHPVQVSPCGPPYGQGDMYGVNVQRNSAGTTVWPSSRLSRVAPAGEGFSCRPSDPAFARCDAEGSYDPVACGAYLDPQMPGKAESFSAEDARRERRADAIYGVAAAEDRPNLSRPYGDYAATFRTGIARLGSVGQLGGHLSPLAYADVDSDFVMNNGSQEYPDEALKESMTSERHREQNTLIASKTGLGSTRIDPRFEPGTESMMPGGGETYAPGSSAGGPSTGALTLSQWGAAPTAISGYIYGFGDNYPYRDIQPEALETENSRWNA